MLRSKLIEAQLITAIDLLNEEGVWLLNHLDHVDTEQYAIRCQLHVESIAFRNTLLQRYEEALAKEAELASEK